MVGCCRRNDLGTLNPQQFDEPDMDERVYGYLNDYRVRNVDYCRNGLVTVIGVALVIFAAWLYLATQTPSWSLLALSGGIALLGGVLTILSIKWMVESCQKNIDYDRWANEIVTR